VRFISVRLIYDVRPISQRTARSSHYPRRALVLNSACGVGVRRFRRGDFSAQVFSGRSGVEYAVMRPLTVFLGRLLGLYTLIISLWLLADKQEAVSTIPDMLGNRPLMVVIAIIAFVGGLAIILGHNIWSGGALPILVTLIGWVALLRGLLFLFLPPAATRQILEAIQFERFFYIYVAIPLILGAYLTYLGFTARAGNRAS
jgi:hypothetical protein